MDEIKLKNDDFTTADAPMALFNAWMDDAKQSEINDPNAFALATIDESGMPNVRMLLLNGLSDIAFTFYTNYQSNKGRELLSAKKAAMCFHWKSLRRQVRLRGLITPVDDETADAYYNSRPRGSRIGAWASQQSRTLENRQELEARVQHFEDKFADGEIARPDYWSGFDLTPLSMEFWHDRPFRLHDRIVFERDHGDDPWRKRRLYP